MVPFASGYAPINDLNASIMAQDARGMQDRLARQELNNRMIAEAINAQVRQKQIASESGDRQQHYALQRQQLANDMAARNRQMALGEATLAQNKTLTDAQAAALGRNPYGDQADADAETFNSEALSGESEANGKIAAINNAHKLNREKIVKGRYFTEKGRQSDLNDLDIKHDYEVAALQQTIKHGDKIRFNRETGQFEALKRMTRRGAATVAPNKTQPVSRSNEQPQFGEEGFDYSGGGVPSNVVDIPVAGNAPVATASPFNPDFMGAAKAVGQSIFTPWKSFGLFGSGQPQTPPVAPIGLVEPPPVQSSPFGGISWNTAPPGFVQGGSTKQPWTGPAERSAPSGGFGWSRTLPIRPPVQPMPAQPAPMQPMPVAPMVLPIPQIQAVDGTHYRTNADGTITILSPIIKSNGQIIAPGTTGMIR